MDESNHPNWLNKVHWYNTAIYSRLHGSLFGYLIIQEITDRYNLLCSLVVHDKKEASY